MGAGTLVQRLFMSRLTRSSGMYVVSNIANRAIPFLLLPVLTRYLTPEDLGIAAMFTLAQGLVAPVVGLNTDGAIARQYFERDRIDYPNYIANCLYILIATTLLVGIVFTAFSRPLTAALSIPRNWIWALVPASVCRFLMQAVLALFQVRERPRAYAALFLVQTVLSFGLSLWLVADRGYDWRGRVLGEVWSLVVVALLASVVLLRGGWVRHGVNPQHLRHALRFGGGLVPHLYGGLLIAATDRLLITHLVGLAATGLYAVGAQVAQIIGVLEHSFNQAWTPWLFDRLKRRDPEELRTIAHLTRVYNIVILVLAAALGLGAPWFLGFFVGPSFHDARQYVVWLAFAGAFTGMYKMVVNQIFYANKTHVLAWITLATGLINVPVTYALIRWNGPVGAAQGTAFSFFVTYALTAKYSARVMAELR